MKLKLKAIIANVEQATEFINEQLEAMGCSRRSTLQIDIAIDELFSNVCHYAYGDSVGDVLVEIEKLPNRDAVSITLDDEGTPFNPLDHEDPDVTLEVHKRQIGGLGIFMVKKSMDEVLYEHRDGHNRLTIIKAL